MRVTHITTTRVRSGTHHTLVRSHAHVHAHAHVHTHAHTHTHTQFMIGQVETATDQVEVTIKRRLGRTPLAHACARARRTPHAHITHARARANTHAHALALAHT